MAQVIRMVPAVVGRRLVRDGREVFDMYPSWGEPCTAWLYAIGFADGRAKIGITGGPRRRMRQHWVSSGQTITWTHLFQAFPEKQSRTIERIAVRMAAGLSQRIRETEIFIGLSKADALRSVRYAIAEYRALPLSHSSRLR